MTDFAELRTSVTVVSRVSTGERDEYGNAVYEDRSYVVGGCLVAPGESSDDQAEADRTTSEATVYDTSGTWPGGAIDRVEFAGASWEIVGQPSRWPGSIAGVVVHLRKVVG